MSLTPFELLLDIERKTLARARKAPARNEIRQQWVGIAFKLRDNALVAPLTAVAEIVTPPAVTGVPGVKPWVVGLANMRGILLPVIDLHRLLFGQQVAIDPRARRVMLVEHARHATGLLVDAILGPKYFWADERSTSLPTLAGELRPYVDSAYHADGETYGLFELGKLVGNELFLDVAA